MFFETKAPDGRRALLNLDLVFMFLEEAEGGVSAVNIAGGKAPLGARYEELRDELDADEDEDD